MKKHLKLIIVSDLIIEELNKRKQVIDINKLSYGENYQNNDYISCQSDGNCHCLGAMNSALTILLEEGVSLAKISAMLGHTSIHTTFEYYCEVMDEKEKILAFMNNLFSIEDGVEYVG